MGYPSVDFDFWGLPIYNLMAIVGLLCSILVMMRKQRMLGIGIKQEEKVNFSFMLAIPAALLFANLVNWVMMPDVLDAPVLERFQIAGFTFYYGMFGFFGSAALLLRLRGCDVRFWINEAVPCVLIFHVFGRIGCSLVGCCYGVVIEHMVLAFERFPARELEAIGLFLMFLVFMFKIKRKRLKLYLMSYAVMRFFLEYGRGDFRGYLLTDAISPAQVTSIAVFGACVLWSAVSACVRTNKKQNVDSNQVTPPATHRQTRPHTPS